jgi:uncharacterized protein (DUF362 family)
VRFIKGLRREKMTDLVSIVKVGNDVQEALNSGLDRIELSINPEVPVIIKPNLCCVKTSETGATTDPRIVEALIRYFRGRFGSREFYIVESDATMLNIDVAFQLLGYKRLSALMGANLVNLSKVPWDFRDFNDNTVQKRIRIPKLFQRPHFLISVAKMKTSDACGVSATLKNMFGCNPEPYKLRYHGQLHHNIVDFAAAYSPSLSIVDGIIGMEGNGPVSGTPVYVGAMMFGTDPVATDHAVARVMGIDPKKIKTLELALQRGLGTFQYNLVGSSLNEMKTRFREPTSVVSKLYSSKVISLLKSCLNATSKLVVSHGRN